MDLNLICRICAKEDRLCIQVFGAEGKKQNVAKKINLCLPIVVREDDNLPQQICLNCLSNLDSSYELYSQCLEAQSVIKNLMAVHRQCNGNMVKVYSTQEMLKMAQELRDKLSENRPVMRLGNTLYTIKDTGCQTEEAPSEETQVAKKRKPPPSRGMMYLGGGGPMGQQYMLMPSPPVMIPSPVAIGHLPYQMAPMQAPTPAVADPPATSAPTPPTAKVQQKAEIAGPVVKVPAQIAAAAAAMAAASAAPPATVPPKIATPPPQITSVEGSVTTTPPSQDPLAPKPALPMSVDEDDDDDEYTADDPDPIQDNDDDAGDLEDSLDMQEAPAESRASAVEGVSSGGTGHLCPYCHKRFPEDVILHHKKLHFRQKFFSCIMCNKNFRTEKGLETHRCD